MAIKSFKIENFLQSPAVVHVFDAIDSTNNEAKRRALTDPDCAVLYVTDCQTAGRGRRGHDFFSPKGSGLYFTLSLPVNGDAADVQLLTCAAAVAVCEAIEALTDREAQIKWVNDIFIDGKKVAGILAELVQDDGNHPARVIVGIGLNLTTAHFPAAFAATAGCVGDTDPNRLCAKITDGMIAMYHNNNSVIEKYSKLNLCIGRIVRYSDADGDHTAKAVEIAPDGSLIVEENGRKKSLRSGEISVIPI